MKYKIWKEYPMTKVELIEEFNTSMGKVYQIKTEDTISVGDIVVIAGKEEVVKQIIMPTKPEIDSFSIVV